MKEHRALTPRQEALAERALFGAILTLRSVEECRAFFRDLCTPAELQALADRWAVVALLQQGVPYREIHKQTGVSVTTIGRVARYLTNGNGGYTLAAERLKDHATDSGRPRAMMDKTSRLKVALQKSGRLTDNSLDLLVRCGLKYSRGKDQLMCYGENMPLDVLFVRDDDIPDLVQQDVCDLGIVGLNVIEEKRLAFQARGVDAAVRAAHGARLRQVPPVDRRARRRRVQRHRVAARQAHRDDLSEHPRRAICASNDVAGGDRDAVRRSRDRAAPRPRRFHLRSGLDRLDADRQSPVGSGHDPGKPGRHHQHARAGVAPRSRIGFTACRCASTACSRSRKASTSCCTRRASKLAEIRKLLPGSESPTIMPLDGVGDKVAVHAVCRENVFWETLESLKSAGASAILVLPVEKMLA